MAEGIKEKKNKIREQKPSVWQRMKKPLSAGLLTASLIFTPVKKADAIYLLARPPVDSVGKEMESDKLGKKAWKILLDYWYGDAGEEHLMVAQKIFDHLYEKTNNPIYFYAGTTTTHYSAVEKKTYIESRDLLLSALKRLESELKKYPGNVSYLSQKQLILKALFHAAYGCYFGLEEYRKWRSLSDLETYYNDAIKFGNDLINFEESFDKIELKDYKLNPSEEKEQNNDSSNKKIPKISAKPIDPKERDVILNYIAKDLNENKKMYEKLMNEKK